MQCRKNTVAGNVYTVGSSLPLSVSSGVLKISNRTGVLSAHELPGLHGDRNISRHLIDIQRMDNRQNRRPRCFKILSEFVAIHCFINVLALACQHSTATGRPGSSCADNTPVRFEIFSTPDDTDSGKLLPTV